MEDKKDFPSNKRKKSEKMRKTEYEKRKTHIEVQQIKKDLINFANTSWGKEWINSMLKLGRPFRMQRGMEYAKEEGRFDNILIKKGQIFATVQGTAPTPYRVKVNIDIIPEEGWSPILNDIGNKILYLIQLLQGSLPEDIINIFENNEYSLFPIPAEGLNAECSCPDKAIPCKHIAAIVLYIAKIIDYNPFILLELRGKNKNEILNDLRLVQSLETVSTNEITNRKTKIDKTVEFAFNKPKIPISEVYRNHIKSNDKIRMSFKFKNPGRVIETVENLGLPRNLENDKTFEIVFKQIYRFVAQKIYKRSSKLN